MWEKCELFDFRLISRINQSITEIIIQLPFSVFLEQERKKDVQISL